MMMNSEYLRELAVLVGLVSIQLVVAVYGVLTSRVMALGLSPYFLIIYGSFATFLFYSPVAFIFERPSVTNGNRISYGKPSLICVTFEKVNLKCWYSRTKILGTLLCIIGAILMSFLHASASKSISTSPTDAASAIDKDKIIGTLCLMSAVIIFSSLVVLQAAIVAEFPAPISICAVTAFIGSVLTAILKLFQEHNLEITSPFISTGKVILFALLDDHVDMGRPNSAYGLYGLSASQYGGIVGGGCNSFGSWAMKAKGPVFVSTFSPIGTVFSITISAVTLGDIIALGRHVNVQLDKVRSHTS
ncbi:hypothetical protein Syun_012424 [Stephania yunnanensis]|uniref:Uncharacterized protein n=1 Tax=Stephania yunnanensis TaxID=152371 RepID=A0AAP0K076_9MAGN